VNRLVETKGWSGGAEAELVELVAACEPVAISEVCKQRSLRAVYDRHHERRQSMRFAMRLALASGVLLAAGGATAAAFGVHWKGRSQAPELVAYTPAPPVHHAARLARAVPAPVAEPAPEIASAPLHHARVVKSEDPALVVAAIQALRQDGEPARAARLLAVYLRTHPRGALAEEAVALSIEAADARHSPAATAFAQRYLKEYPHGRFRPAAERALARSAL
jgi:hypothetical protein